MKQLEVVLDCETNGLLHQYDKLHLVSFCYRKQPNQEIHAGFIELRMKLGDKIPDTSNAKMLVNILSNQVIKHPNGVDEYQLVPCFHNAPYDIEVLKSFGFPEPKIFHDTLLAGWMLMPTVAEEKIQVLNPRYVPGGKCQKYITRLSKYSLAAWGKRLGLKSQKFETPSFDEYTEELEVYGVQDARSQHELMEFILPRLREDEKAWKLYTQVDLPYLTTIRQLQNAGLYFDLEKLEKLKVELEEKQQDINTRIDNLVGLVPLGDRSKTINPKNPDDLADTQEDAIEGMFKYYGTEVDKKDGRTRHVYRKWCKFLPTSADHKLFALRTLYGFQSSKRTATGREAVDKEVLKKASDLPLAKMLNEHSQYEKLLNTYVRKFIDSGGHSYADWNPQGTVTGRISSSNPNFQNLPARTDYGKIIRDSVIPRNDDYVLVGCDLSQIELRVLAWFLIKMFGDELDDYPDAATLWNAFHNDEDPHQLKADEAGISRTDAKTFNFGDLYGLTIS